MQRKVIASLSVRRRVFWKDEDEAKCMVKTATLAVRSESYFTQWCSVRLRDIPPQYGMLFGLLFAAAFLGLIAGVVATIPK